MVRRWSAYIYIVRLRGDTSVGRRPLASAASPLLRCVAVLCLHVCVKDSVCSSWIVVF